MESYIVNLTFHAGSDSPEDTDNGLYLLQTTKPMTEQMLKQDFMKTNALLDTFREEDEESLSITYDVGLNIDTLVIGYMELTNNIMSKISDKLQYPLLINNYFTIEQWQ